MLYLQPVIDALNKFNGRGKATYILCSDFFNLAYTDTL